MSPNLDISHMLSLHDYQKIFDHILAPNFKLSEIGENQFNEIIAALCLNKHRRIDQIFSILAESEHFDVKQIPNSFIQRLNISNKQALVLKMFNQGNIEDAYSLNAQILEVLKKNKYINQLKNQKELNQLINQEDLEFKVEYDFIFGHKVDSKNIVEMKGTNFLKEKVENYKGMKEEGIVSLMKLVNNTAGVDEAIECLVLYYESKQVVEKIKSKIYKVGNNEKKKSSIPGTDKPRKDQSIVSSNLYSIHKSISALGILESKDERTFEDSDQSNFSNEHIVHLINSKQFKSALKTIKKKEQEEGQTSLTVYLKAEVLYMLNRYVDLLLLLDDTYANHTFSQTTLIRLKQIEANVFYELERMEEYKRCNREIVRIKDETLK